jgi:chemotaxis protein CheD
MIVKEPGFATIRYSERDFDTYAVKILPGEYFATSDATAIATLLGSCVSVCLYDKKRGVGGMNHFMLPKVLLHTDVTRCSLPYAPPCANPCSARYGECAFKHLLERLEVLGARRTNLEAKLFGAGRVMAGGSDIGKQNAEFALGYLEERSIPVVASDLGQHYSRKLVFFPATGRVFVKRLHNEPRGIF